MSSQVRMARGQGGGRRREGAVMTMERGEKFLKSTKRETEREPGYLEFLTFAFYHLLCPQAI